MKNLKAIILEMLCAVAIVSCTSVPEPFPDSSDRLPYDREITPGLGYQKVMILYSEGYNDLVSNLALNINQFCQGDVPYFNERNVVLVYSHAAERRGDYTTETAPVLYRLYTHGDSVCKDTLATFDPKANTLTPGFMRSVMETIARTFPSRHYGLVISSHGNGWIPSDYSGENLDMSIAPSWIGAQYDGSYRNRKSLDISQLRDAIPFRLDYIAFDACLMGGVEVAYALREKTRYLVFSQTEVLADGLCNYPTIASRLFRTGGPDLKGLCEDAYSHYSALSGQEQSVTVSLVDTDGLDRLAEVCAGLFDDYRTEISNVSMYDVQQYYRFSKRWYFDIEDILVKSGVPDAALADFREALSSCVVYKAATPRFLSIDIVSFSGLSMYLPCADANTALRNFYRGLSWNQATGLLN